MSDTSNSFPTSLNGFDAARATSYLVTAANWNALHAAVNAIETKLGIGTSIGVAKLAQAPYADVYNNANINLLDNTPTTLTFNSEIADTDTIHDTGSNTSRLTCKTSGVYDISGHVMIDDAFTAGARELRIVGNISSSSVTLARITTNAFSIGGTSARLSVAANGIVLAVNDYVELIAEIAGAGGTCVALAASTTNRDRLSFRMVRVGTS
jgi:hypothetical protein